MQTLLTVYESAIHPGTLDHDPIAFSHREAVRAVVVNEQGQVALLKVSKHGYHKLPGGGIEATEDKQQALRRELMEEIGCTAEVTEEVGQIIEFRDEWKMKQTSSCYVAKKAGNQRPPTFTEEEADAGFEMIWADDIDAAITLLENDKPTGYEAGFIQKRDLKFLEAAKALL